jgi:ribosomal protein S18 acetylase RimI-like enzyme
VSAQFAALSAEWERPLEAMLAALRASGEEELFHPHPFTAEVLARLARRPGKDYYCVLAEGRTVLGYGLLRGWDEGYQVPRLGIAVHPDFRRRGHAARLMAHLHEEAARRGAAKVELRVLESNEAASKLYRALGYRFERKDGAYLVGVLELGK